MWLVRYISISVVLINNMEEPDSMGNEDDL